ncbi:MAG: energy transducer TonB [Ignavibacteriaceae bacterium]|jgi:protein TonB|nr:energy transducer TonB [Ignavibacteriaceae bacterium]
MSSEQSQKNSYFISIIIHVIIAVIFYFVTFSPGESEEEYVTVGFGSGFAGGAGRVVNNIDPNPEKKKELETKKEEKDVKLPEAKNTDNDNISIAKDKKNEKKDKKTNEEKNLEEFVNQSGQGIEGAGAGSLGFEIDFGGKGIRRIYSYTLPAYPEGVAKEIDVRIKFSILPDGSIGKIMPLIKADARLESAAINSLRQWRFEPLPNNAKQIEQSVIITFPFRLQ